MTLKPLAALFGFVLFSAMTQASQPVPESPRWLTYPGGDGPGKGKHIVLLAAEQEYRSEQSMPMMAAMLAKHHGFDCTVLFSVNAEGLVDPTAPVFPEKGKEDEFKPHHIPGLEHLAKADLLIFVARLLTLPDEQLKHIVDYLDSGKPVIGLRTANHGFRSPLPYEIDGKRVTIGEILGGSFMNHHGNWQQDSTRGDIVPAMKEHPVLTGVKDIWGPTDVYRTFKEGTGLPEGCTALVYGQPLIGREQGGKDNPEKEPLPVVWFKGWKTTGGKTARVLQSTMGSAKDLENPGLRRLIVNAAYWGLEMESAITADRSVDYASEYKPLSSGFDYAKVGVVPRPASAYR
jgi:type 1 glutamine amidotransferase